MAFTYGAQKRLRLLHKARAAADAYGASELRKKKKEKQVQIGESDPFGLLFRRHSAYHMKPRRV